MTRRRVGAAIVVAVVIAAAVAAVAQTVFAEGSASPKTINRARSASDAIPNLPARLQTAAARVGLDLNTTRLVATAVYLANKTDGELCMVGTAHGMTMGCAPKSSFFGTNALQYGISEDGKPDAPTALTIFGVTQPSVKSVQVVFPSGPVDQTVTASGGFSVSATSAELAQGRPTRLLAKDANGAVIQTFALPQG